MDDRGGRRPTTYAEVGPPEYSDDGKHIAYAAKAAKKWRLVVDGEPRGGEFDDIGARSFSPDGQRVAYVGRRRNKFVVVLDEKEGTPFDIVGGIGFSSDSRRFGYAGADVNHGFGKQRAVGRTNIDGTAGPTFEGAQIGSLLKNMATASTPYLVVGYLPQLLSDTDGVTAPVLSPDGRRVAYAARRDKETSTVIVDGQPGPALPSIVAGPVFSPDSQHVAVVISEGDAKILVVDGVKTTGSAASGTDFILDLAFAANNRRGAYIGIDGGNMYEQGYTRRARRRVYVDGTPGPEYNALYLGQLQFTPDGAHITYIVGLSEANERRLRRRRPARGQAIRRYFRSRPRQRRCARDHLHGTDGAATLSRDPAARADRSLALVTVLSLRACNKTPHGTRRVGAFGRITKRYRLIARPIRCRVRRR
jgi:roadblock/LC7 domain-containing protein